MNERAVKNQVVWFDVPCTDLDRAIRFYSAVLGAEVSRHEMAPGFALGVLPHQGPAVGGCLVIAKDNSPSDHGVLIYLNCSGRLDEAIAAAATHGGKVLLPKESIGQHGYRAIVRDSEGNRVALHSA
jgi:predicted enzyme related to lactoylglutathione lyase